MLAKMVTVLAQVCEASAVAVWSCEFGQLQLRHSTALAQALFNLSHRVWDELRADLQGGRIVVEDGATFVPLQGARHTLVGMLTLDVLLPDSGPRRLYLDEQIQLVAKHVQLPAPTPIADVVVVPVGTLEQPDGDAELQRLIYSAVLTRHGWNVSLVAGLVGVARPTLAARLRALGLKRPRPSPKARTPKRDRSDLAEAMQHVLWPRVPASLPRRRR